MANPITELPPEGEFVYVTDNGTEIYAAFWAGHWRETLTDGGWLEFSDAATWDTVSGAAPKPAKKAKPALATAEAEVAAAEAEAQTAEADLNAAEQP